MKVDFIQLLGVMVAAFSIFVAGMVAEAEFEIVHAKATQAPKPAAAAANGYLQNFSDDSMTCFERGQWAVCTPKKPPDATWSGDACFNGYGNVVPCSKEEQQ